MGLSAPDLAVPILAAAASIFAAVVSASVSVWASRRTGSQKLAEMRQAWIDDLRSNLAEFVGLMHKIMNETGSGTDGAERIKLFQELNADLMRIESYISMKLNHDERPAKRLVNVMGQIRGCAAYMSHGHLEVVRKADEHLQEFQAISRLVLKSEWARVKNDIARVSARERRRQADLIDEKLKKIPNTLPSSIVL